MSEKSQTIGVFTVSQLSHETNKSGESGAFLFSRRVPDFCDGRRSFPTNENSNLYRRGPSAMDLAHYQSSKLPGSRPPITNKHGVSEE